MVAFKLMGIEYPEKPSKKSTSSDDGMNPVVMTGAVMALADEDGPSSDSSLSDNNSSSSSFSSSSSSYGSGSSSSSD